jgi:hypothetical protein
VSESIFEVISCISFKGTQYKEFKFLRELFKTIDSQYSPQSIKIPISYSFYIQFGLEMLQKTDLQIPEFSVDK